MKIEITEAQLKAIKDLADTLSAMLGCGEDGFDVQMKKNVKLVDRMLKKNNLTPRVYK